MLATDRQPLPERSAATVALANTAIVVGFAAAIFIAGQVRVPLPFTPVPITLQTFVLYLGASWLGAGRGVAGPAVFALGAAAGLPILSGFQSGFTGATVGYVIGWMLAAFLLGSVLGGRQAETRRIVASMMGASAVIYTCGALHLMLLMDLSFGQALLMGVVPFLPGDAVKIGLASATYRRWPDLLSSS